MTRLCKDCRYAKDTHMAPVFWVCTAPASYTKFSPLTGLRVQPILYCRLLRVLPEDCGEQGAWFEPKEAVAA